MEGTGGDLVVMLSRLHTVADVSKLFTTVDTDALFLLLLLLTSV